MTKKNKRILLLTSLFMLLPILFGIAFWDALPEQITTHWGPNGVADGSGAKGFVVFGLPLLILAMYWFCVFLTLRDPKNQKQSDKVFGMLLLIIPVIDGFSMALIYAGAFGVQMPIEKLLLAVMGLNFVLFGNYIPKCRQNYTIGIKVPWALHDEKNWNATHRLCGKVWVIGGLVIMAGAFLPRAVNPWIGTAVPILLVVIPVVYSYLYDRKQRNSKE